MRVLDCKVERDREIAQELPKTKDHLCESCKTNFDQVQTLLDSTQTPYSLNPLLVRGLDYYTRTTFEVVSTGLGAQNAICGGGRYDSLVEEFEGPPTPCFGFALGMERLISVIPFDDKIDLEIRPDIFVVGLGDEARSVTFKIIHELRQNGFSVEQDYVGGSMKSQMRKANKSGARFSLIVGENEIKSGKLLLKDMGNGSQNEVSAQDLTHALRQQMDNPSLPSPAEK